MKSVTFLFKILVRTLLPLDLSNQQKPDEVLLRLCELMRKIYNTENFKGFASPHEFTHAVISASKGQFKIGKQSDPGDFLLWILQRLHRKLSKPSSVRYGRSSIVSDNFELEIETVTLKEGGEPVKEVGRHVFLIHFWVDN